MEEISLYMYNNHTNKIIIFGVIINFVNIVDGIMNFQMVALINNSKNCTYQVVVLKKKNYQNVGLLRDKEIGSKITF